MNAHNAGEWTLYCFIAAIVATQTISYKPVRKPSTQSRMAVSLEMRRLGDYFWWLGETLMDGIIVFSWVLLFIRGDARSHWSAPVVFTYAFVGLLLLEIWTVRRGFPLPADRPEEHRRWMQAGRRHMVRVLRIWRWFLVTVLGAYALLHDRDMGAASPWVYRLFVGVGFALFAAFVVTMVPRNILDDHRYEGRFAPRGRLVRALPPR